MSLPGANKQDHWNTTNTPEQKAAARRAVTWHARTDTEADRFLSQLGLDEPIPYTLTPKANRS